MKFCLRVVGAFLVVLLVFGSCISVSYVFNGSNYGDDIEATAWMLPDRGMELLIIDPGHGGADGGAVSVTGTYESDINLQIALKIEQLAALYGCRSVMTRYTQDIEYPDDALTIRAKKIADQKGRVSLINSFNNAVLISIHQNKYTSSEPRGGQVFYSPVPRSREMGEYMQQLLAENTDTRNRTARQIPDSIYLMNSITCPGILVECGFLSNREEAILLESDNYQKKLATVIAGGAIGALKTS